MNTELQQLAACLRDDFLLLADGAWEPDPESINCSIENAEKVIKGIKALQADNEGMKAALEKIAVNQAK